MDCLCNWPATSDLKSSRIDFVEFGRCFNVQLTYQTPFEQFGCDRTSEQFGAIALESDLVGRSEVATNTQTVGEHAEWLVKEGGRVTHD
jgi:hypothetical protein